MKHDYSRKITNWLRQDETRFSALECAAGLGLDDWCLAAGFVRNLVWDRMHQKVSSTPLNDIDLIYFDLSDTSEDTERRYEEDLRRMLDIPWSVKNQARMHHRNNDKPYCSTCDAMSYWVEVETAVGAFLATDGKIEIVAPFGLQPLFNYTITLNEKRKKLDDFERRVNTKAWLEIWPKLKVVI